MTSTRGGRATRRHGRSRRTTRCGGSRSCSRTAGELRAAQAPLVRALGDLPDPADRVARSRARGRRARVRVGARHRLDPDVAACDRRRAPPGDPALARRDGRDRRRRRTVRGQRGIRRAGAPAPPQYAIRSKQVPMAIETTTVEVVMPAMGDSVSEGTVLEWHKAEGDSVSADETLVEISTDKVDAEVPAPIDGTVVKVHAAEGDTIHVGAVLAEIAPSNGAGPAAAPEAPEAPAEEQLVDIVMPQMGESVSEGVVLEWAKQVGDSVEADDTIVEISTDKVDAEVPAPASGTVTEILAQPGETVTVGQVIGRMAAGAEAEKEDVPAPEPATSAQPEPVEVPDGSRITPVARRVAAAHGIDLANVHGSGPAGRIGKEDVLAAANGAAPAAAPAAGATLIKGASAMLARYMDESREVPTATSFRTITVTTLDARRKELKNAGHRVSFTHLIAYAIARAGTEQMPVMAHHFDTIDGKPNVIDDGACNLGIAVDVERKDGGRTLMVPVIRDAGRLSFQQFLDAFDELIAKARENRLGADDLQGANVSLTNPGGIGTIASVPRLMKG